MNNIKVFLCNKDGRILSANETAIDSLGVPKAEMEKMSVVDFGVSAETLQKAKENGKQEKQHGELVCRGGGHIACDMSVMYAQGGDGFLVWCG